MKTFVVAGTNEQAQNWIRQNITDYATTHGSWRSLSDYIIVNSEMNLKGHSDPHGVFVGTWRERRDLKDIVQLLMVQSTNPNPALGKIWKEL